MSLQPLNPVLIESAAARHALPALLIAAIVQQESGGNPWAWNPEPHYRYLWDVRRRAPFRQLSSAEISSERPPADFPVIAGDRDQEWWAQQASWGLMQVMGAVAREWGYREPYLPALCDPETNIEYGCRHLLGLRQRHFRGHGWSGVIAAYNAGSPRLGDDGKYVNQQYVDEVNARLKGAKL